MAKRELIGLASTLWAFFSMVIVPLALLDALKQGRILGMQIALQGLDVGLIALLGVAATASTGLAYAFGGYVDVALTFAKSLIYSYYQWVWFQGIKDIQILGVGVSISVYAELLVLLYIIGTLLSGAFKTIHKYLVIKEKRLKGE
ncbi:MAG: hypothetical protein NDP13_04125 [Crenarchaeota archaeon]|nr:hypothetical protein [Thermoproteota archaeon]MCR8455538.1 hypothetical protein [Thermoproteota archaeon]MCR8501790.1 hypothetical protein [Thermoproteota archaeon]